MELVDIVDEKDNVVGSSDIEDSHTNQTLHRVVVVFVFTPDGQLYVQKRLDNGKLDHSIGGHVHKGETYDQAAQREALEEYGISDPLKRICVFLPDAELRDPQRQHMYALYTCTPSKEWVYKASEVEAEYVKPMPIETIVDEMHKEPSKFTFGFRATLKKYLETVKE